MFVGDWEGQRVLVTGGAGFLGSALCHALAARGAIVTALDSFASNTGANHANLHGADIDLVEADLHSDELGPACHGVAVMFNLAAQGGHWSGEIDPARDLSTNAASQLRLIQALRDHAPDAVVVHASTRQIYGRPLYLPVDEAHPISPIDSNGVSKWAGEQYWLLERKHRKRRLAVLRLTNCYGPRQHIRDDGQSFLGGWIRRLLRRETFEVWGGQQLRDLLFVEDAVAAFLAAALLPGCADAVFNVGGAPALPLHAIAELLAAEEQGGPGFAVRQMPEDRAAIDIGDYVSDDRLFRAATGWEPSTGVGDGLRATADWFRPRMPAYA